MIRFVNSLKSGTVKAVSPCDRAVDQAGQTVEPSNASDRCSDSNHFVVRKRSWPALNSCMHMIRKGQMMTEVGNEMSFANQFYALAGQIRPA